MIRPDSLLLLGLLAALPVQAAEALDADFIAFLAEEAEDAAQTESTFESEPELVAWLRDWWNPAEENAGNRTEKSP